MKSGSTRSIRCEVVVVAPVDVREAEDEVAQAVALRVGVDERLRGDLRRRVRALGVGEVGGRLAVLLEAVDVAVDLARRGEDERQLERAAVLEDVEGHHRVLERALRLADELVHLRVRGEVDDEVDLRVLDAVHAAAERRVVPGEVLQQRVEVASSRCSAACRRRRPRARRRAGAARGSCRSGPTSR